MAEINVNSSHNHSFSDYVESLETVMKSATLATCEAGHTTCRVSSYTTFRVEANRTSTYYTDAYKQTGEININIAHPHTYSRKAAASSETGVYLYPGYCQANHSDCTFQILSYTAVTSYTTTSATSSSYQQTGEVRVYVNHSHSVSTLATNPINARSTDTYIGTCPLGHSSCQYPGFYKNVHPSNLTSQTSGSARY